MRPKRPAVAHFVQLRDTHTVFVGRHVLCFDVHCHLCQIQVGSDPGRRRNAGCFKDIQNDPHRKVARRQLVGFQIVCHVHKDLIDGVHNDVFRRDVFHVDLINPRAVLHVIGHPWRRDQEVNGQPGISLQF